MHEVNLLWSSLHLHQKQAHNERLWRELEGAGGGWRGVFVFCAGLSVRQPWRVSEVQTSEPSAAPGWELETLRRAETPAVKQSGPARRCSSPGYLLPPQPQGFHSSKGKRSSSDFKVSYASWFSGCKGLEWYPKPPIMTIHLRRINDLCEYLRHFCFTR